MGFDHVSRFIKRMGHGTGIKIGVALGIGRVEEHVRVRSLWHAEEFDHFAIEVNKVVQFHLLVIVQSRAGPIGVNGAKVDGGVADGLQQHAFHRSAVGVQHLDFGVRRRTALSRLGFDDPGLTGLRVKSEQVDIRLLADSLRARVFVGRA